MPTHHTHVPSINAIAKDWFLNCFFEREVPHYLTYQADWPASCRDLCVKKLIFFGDPLKLRFYFGNSKKLRFLLVWTIMIPRDTCLRLALNFIHCSFQSWCIEGSAELEYVGFSLSNFPATNQGSKVPQVQLIMILGGKDRQHPMWLWVPKSVVTQLMGWWVIIPLQK